VRQHGDGAVGEVDAVAAEAGFGVERRAWADVPTYVGDVDLEPGVAIGERCDENCIVEVAGGLAVDGDDGEVAEVFPLGELFGVERGDGFLRTFGGLDEDWRGEGVGDVVLADDDFYVDTEGVGWAEDFDEASASGAAGSGEAGDLDVDGQAFKREAWVEFLGLRASAGLFAQGAVGGFGGLGKDLVAVRDEDGAGDALVEWSDIVAGEGGGVNVARVATGVVKDADDSRVTAGQDTGDTTASASVAYGRGFVDENEISLHGSVDLVGRDKDVGIFGCTGARGRIGTDETEAVAMKIEFSTDETVAPGTYRCLHTIPARWFGGPKGATRVDTGYITGCTGRWR
jgi:hypothetical protein